MSREENDAKVHFIGVDVNSKSIALLRERAGKAGLTNVSAVCGLIETYQGECDVALALHVCGAGTDAVLLQAVSRRCAFIVAPCCVGKLKRNGLKSIQAMKNERARETRVSEAPKSHSTGDATEDFSEEEDDAVSEEDDDAVSDDAVSDDAVSDDDDDDAVSEDDDVLIVPGEPFAPMRVIHPRSSWMRGVVQRPVYLGLAAAADWSGHQGVDPTVKSDASEELGRFPRIAKAAVELDRAAAAAEAGYGVRVMKMTHSGAGLKNDLIIGFPENADPLKKYVEGPEASFWKGHERV
jgi:hypothetical protein